MVVDIFTFNGEYDILEIRLNILNDFVDQFIIVEAPTTFSGLPKPLYFNLAQSMGRFDKWKKKIKYFVIDENYTPDEVMTAESSPNTQGASHWKHEFLQKESIRKALTHLNDSDLVFVSDVDEIWNPKCIWNTFTGSPFRLRLKVYTYYLNNRSNEEFYGGLVSKYYFIKHECLNHLRTTAWNTAFYGGWHFTSMGGYEEVKRKLLQSYNQETYASPEIINSLYSNILINRDFLGRNFTYRKDERYWPQFLKKNKNKYKHLCL